MRDPQWYGLARRPTNGVKGDKGDPGEGGLRVVDAAGTLVGAFVALDAVIVDINGDFVQIGLKGGTFASCSTGSSSCAMYQFEQPNCAGTAYMTAGNGLVQLALVVDDSIHYPSGPVAMRDVGSLRVDAGACMNFPPGFTQQNAEAKSAPVASLGLSGAFHLAR